MLSLPNTISFLVRFSKGYLNGMFILNRYLCLVVGEREKTARTVNVRTRDNKVHGEFSIDEVVAKFQNLQNTRTISEDTF